jgi:hypothetical protein
MFQNNKNNKNNNNRSSIYNFKLKRPNNNNDNNRRNNAGGDSKTNDTNTVILQYIGSFLLLMVVIGAIYTSISYYYYYISSCYSKMEFIEYLKNNVVMDADLCDKMQKPSENILQELGLDKEEVYMVNNQIYTYDNAACKCASLNGRLATKAELTDAYNKGMTTCNYGWLDNNNAMFVVNKKAWNKMNNKERESCRAPGINGGHFPNSDLKFGVYCYGVKPPGQVVLPKSLQEEKVPYCEKKKTVDFIDETDNKDEIVSFNKQQWSTFD